MTVKIKATPHTPVYCIEVSKRECAIELAKSAAHRIGGIILQAGDMFLLQFECAAPLSSGVCAGWGHNGVTQKVELFTEGDFIPDGVYPLRAVHKKLSPEAAIREPKGQMDADGPRLLISDAHDVMARAGFPVAEISPPKPEEPEAPEQPAETEAVQESAPAAEETVLEPNAAIDFLRLLRPGGPHAITTIVPDGPTLTRTFMPNEENEAKRFIADENAGGKNIYYTPNLTGVVTKKPTKDDITAVDYLHVDADPDPNETPEQFRTRMLPVFEGFEPKPGFIVESGNGLNVLWPVTRTARDENTQLVVEAINAGLATHFGADRGTQNIDRILRLPGTRNHPNKKKRSLGRRPCEARLLKTNGMARYELEAFARFRKRAAIRPATANLLHERNAPDRSAVLYRYVNECLRHGVADDVIIDAALDSRGAIRDHINDQSQEPYAYMLRQLEQARIKERPQARPEGQKQGREGHDPLTEDAMALRFSEKYRDSLRYIATQSQWLQWDPAGRWREEKTAKAFDLIREGCREDAETYGNGRPPKDVFCASTVSAVERMARADRRQASVVEAWDTDEWAFNAVGETVDLRTGVGRPPNPLDYITKQAACAIAPPGTPHPVWSAFLERVQPDPEVRAFLKRWCGYCLTGETMEHAFVFFWGTGQNGKSTFIDTIAGILADYGTVADIGTFIASNVERHPTDMAKLHGPRLVTAQETERGRRWDETKIKTLTGGDKMTARRMRCDFFDFAPRFKLVIAGNYKPRLDGVDEAMRQRLLLVLWGIRIPKQERDRQLTKKLRKEWPAILRWMIEGCLEWQQTGLAPPKAVTAATDEYFEDQDTIKQWLDECIQDSPKFTELNLLYSSWKQWCEARGLYTQNSRWLGDALVDRGYTRKKATDGVRGFIGIVLKRADAESEDVVI